MRFKSKKQAGFQVFAVTGINTVSFAITATEAARKGLLGFAVEREDPTENQKYFMQGMKVFPSVIPVPTEGTRVSTWDHPIQSFVWDDFTAKAERSYVYRFHPIRGTPKNLDRSATPIEARITTEALYSKGTHDVFFNRGVASSQAYAAQFRNLPPSKITDPALKQKALDWLSRDLDDAVLRFIKQAKKGDGLLGCFYEFRYLPVAQELAAAIGRGVKVQLVVDAKDNSSVDKKTGKVTEAFPRNDNLKMIKDAGLPRKQVLLREMRPDDIQHNKFMVLVPKGKPPSQVWTGSTNLSDGGFHGQTNVGHWVRDAGTAEAFRQYWDLLATDPGAMEGKTPEGRAANAAFLAAVGQISPTLDPEVDIAAGITPIFSPRKGLAMLKRYIELLDNAQSLACITLAFGINKAFKEALSDHTPASPLTFVLLEKEDKPKKDSEAAWVSLSSKQNIYKAWGSFLGDAVYQFAQETNAKFLKLNVHVSYIHSKFMLVDPLGADPIVVTGSANFSDASTSSNDENMLIIRGDRRVADIYFTEFNRLFFHYYFRSVVEATSRMAEESAGLPGTSQRAAVPEGEAAGLAGRLPGGQAQGQAGVGAGEHERFRQLMTIFLKQRFEI